MNCGSTIMDYKFGTMRQEAAVGCLMYYPDVCLEGLSNTTKCQSGQPIFLPWFIPQTSAIRNRFVRWSIMDWRMLCWCFLMIG